MFPQEQGNRKRPAAASAIKPHLWRWMWPVDTGGFFIYILQNNTKLLLNILKTRLQGIAGLNIYHLAKSSWLTSAVSRCSDNGSQEAISQLDIKAWLPQRRMVINVFISMFIPQRQLSWRIVSVFPSGSASKSRLWSNVTADNMGLLSDPNRRRALISMLTRLNAPIWWALVSANRQPTFV